MYLKLLSDLIAKKMGAKWFEIGRIIACIIKITTCIIRTTPAVVEQQHALIE